MLSFQLSAKFLTLRPVLGIPYFHFVLFERKKILSRRSSVTSKSEHFFTGFMVDDVFFFKYIKLFLKM